MIVALDIVCAGRHSAASESIKAALERLTGVRTVPQTFFAGRFIGGGDELMEAFCSYLEARGRRMDKGKLLFQSLPTPASARGFGLSLLVSLS